MLFLADSFLADSRRRDEKRRLEHADENLLDMVQPLGAGRWKCGHECGKLDSDTVVVSLIPFANSSPL